MSGLLQDAETSRERESLNRPRGIPVACARCSASTHFQIQRTSAGTVRALRLQLRKMNMLASSSEHGKVEGTPHPVVIIDYRISGKH